MWQKNQAPSLLDMINQTRRARCGRWHDRLFGIMGMTPDGIELVSESDYRATTEELSVSTTRDYIERRS